MINLIATNSLLSRKQFVGLFCNVAEAQEYAVISAGMLHAPKPMTWEELPEGHFTREAFMRGSLLPVRVIRAYVEESMFVILDYGF